MKEQYAEDCNYWKSSQSSPDSWLNKSIGLIEGVGGKVIHSGSACEHGTGRVAFMLTFTLQDEPYKMLWPALPSKHGEDYAAQRQAATGMFHDIKARIVSAKVLGARAAFFVFKQLGDGRSMVEVADHELESEFPRLLAASSVPRKAQEGTTQVNENGE